MKKLILVLAAATMFAACNKKVVEFPDGRRISVRTTLYDVGDTVYVNESGFEPTISEYVWRDTAYARIMPDSTLHFVIINKGVIIK